jgi:hypothetical protein
MVTARELRTKFQHKPLKVTHSLSTSAERLCFVFSPEGASLYATPHLDAERITYLPFGATLNARPLSESPENQWLMAYYQGKKCYALTASFSRFPIIETQETIEEYAQRLEREALLLAFEIVEEAYYQREYKFLLPTNCMREAYHLAQTLYPTRFQLPKQSVQPIELITKFDKQKNIIEEFEITSSEEHKILKIDYLADFGNSTDRLTLSLQDSESVFMLLGNYTGAEGRVIY